MKLAVISGISIFVAWVMLALAQLWFEPLTGEVFFKISVSAGMVLILIIIVSLAIREYLTDKDLKDKGFLD